MDGDGADEAEEPHYEQQDSAMVSDGNAMTDMLTEASARVWTSGSLLISPQAHHPHSYA